jgi:hypothetical protein
MVSSFLTEYAIQQRINRINNKKINGNYKSKLFNNQMFYKFCSNIRNNNNELNNKINKYQDSINNTNQEKVHYFYKTLIKISKVKIEQNNKLRNYALMINDIINNLHDTVENSSPIINTPEHPFTKMNIERCLMIGTSIQPYIYESLPIINIDENDIVYGVWTDRIDIGGFIDDNINQIYNLIINNTTNEYLKHNDDTLEVKLYELKYEHINGNVSFIRSMIIDPKNNLMTLIKTWNIVLNC